MKSSIYTYDTSKACFKRTNTPLRITQVTNANFAYRLFSRQLVNGETSKACTCTCT